MKLRHVRAYRLARVAAILSRSLPPYLWLLLRERIGSGAGDAAWARVHERTAARLDAMIGELGGVFVKFAQIGGARADLLPDAFVRRLRRYHDAVPPRPLGELRPHVERELGAPLEEVFAELEGDALAAASIAQVHAGRLRDGSAVVAKIRYPEVTRIVPLDLAVGRAVSRLVSRLSGTDFRSFVGEVTRFVELELDFEREARSTERGRRELEPLGFVCVPRVHATLCRPSLLVLERLFGVRIAAVEELRSAGHDPGHVARRVARLYATMIFESGFFHGDPHPGNLLVLADGRIGLLDFGLCKELPPGFGRRVAALIVRAEAGDATGAVSAMRLLGFDVDRVDPRALLALLGMLFGRTPAGAPPLPLLLRSNPLARVPEDIALVVRALILLMGLSHLLAPGEQVVQAELAERAALVDARNAPAA